MFDIGWSEILVVGAVALVVVGPKDLPKMMRKAGQWTGRARAMADQLKKSFDDMARQSELDELRAEVERMRGNNALSDIEREIRQDVALPDITPPEVKALESDLKDIANAPNMASAPQMPIESSPSEAPDAPKSEG